MKFVVAFAVVALLCAAVNEGEAALPITLGPITLPGDLGQLVGNIVELIVGLVALAVCAVLNIVKQLVSGLCPLTLNLDVLVTCDGNQTQSLLSAVVTVSRGILGNVQAILTGLTSNPPLSLLNNLLG